MKALAKKKKSAHEPKPDTKVILELIQYNEGDYQRKDNLSVEEIITELKPKHVNWVNVDGLHNHGIIDQLGRHFCVHALLLEDITSDHQPSRRIR